MKDFTISMAELLIKMEGYISFHRLPWKIMNLVLSTLGESLLDADQAFIWFSSVFSVLRFYYTNIIINNNSDTNILYTCLIIYNTKRRVYISKCKSTSIHLSDVNNNKFI